MDYIKINISVDQLTESLSEILVAKLSELGMESFEETEDALISYVPEDSFNRVEVEKFLRLMVVNFEVEKILDQNWNKKWEDGFRFIDVDGKVLIRAEFHEAEKEYQYVLNINPKMAFGTGHHQTTRLMIRQMLNMDFNEKTVLDFGTGTGVLSILAEKMNASKMYAFDIDEWSVVNAKENAEINNCTKIEIVQSNGDDIPDVKYDIILANIIRNTLLEKKDVIMKHLKPDGKVLLSGLYEKDLVSVIPRFEETGLKFDGIVQEDEWVSALFVK